MRTVIPIAVILVLVAGGGIYVLVRHYLNVVADATDAMNTASDWGEELLTARDRLANAKGLLREAVKNAGDVFIAHDRQCPWTPKHANQDTCTCWVAQAKALLEQALLSDRS